MNKTARIFDIAVGQIGGRMYYGVPAILFKHNFLSKLYTDWVANKFPISLLYKTFKNIQPRLNSRITPFDPHLIKQMLFTSLWKEIEKKFMCYSPDLIHCKYYYELGIALENLIIKDNFNGAQAIFMIGSSSALVFREAKTKGIITIKEQIIAPPQYTLSILSDVWKQFPDWENEEAERTILNFWSNQVWKEWEHADHIVCGSDFVVETIRQVGGPSERAVAIPYGVPFKEKLVPSPKNFDGKRKLKILSVGTLGLRKGTPYTILAAKELQKECEFTLVGSFPERLPNLLKNIPENVKITGHIPRSQIGNYYQWADVFLLPSLVEGSATVCYEALGYGLPLIVTPNAGQFIEHGKEGFIISPKSSKEIVDALSNLINQPHLVNEMSVNALKISNQATFDAYEKRLITFLKSLI
ncbi:MAG: glycosyltransferase family 4 protein [Bacteroidales bacterium]|nr:glycosyltransferase family 4 protein [Bacteroidales bacterium]